VAVVGAEGTMNTKETQAALLSLRPSSTMPRCKGTLTFAGRSRYLYIVKNRLRELRTGRNLSQVEIARALGVSRQTVISIENGRYSPSLALAFQIAHYFDSTVDAMFDASKEIPK
jgi:putative transcriptional regulator